MKSPVLACLLLFFLLGCSEDKDNKDELLDVPPSNLTLDVRLDGASINPHGDGSGIVSFLATATNAVYFDFKVNDGEAVRSNSGNFSYTFTKQGTHTHKITAIAYAENELFDSISKEFIVRVAPPSKYGMTQVWADEFDYDGPVNPAKWHHQIVPIIGNSWANNEVQHYTDRTDNSYVSDGSLKIVAQKEQYQFRGNTKSYTSARLNSKYIFKYGRVDIRAKLPAEAGTWPAFWTLGANINETGNYFGNTYGSVGWPACGEIDIMEQRGDDKNTLIGHLHWGDTQTGEYKNTGETKPVQNVSNQFNIYSLVWTATSIKVLFNDEIVLDTPNTSDMPYDNPHYLLLNIAMGGNLGGAIPANFSQSVMEIDYLRIYQ